LYLAAYKNELGFDAALDQLLRTRQEITAKTETVLLAPKNENLSHTGCQSIQYCITGL